MAEPATLFDMGDLANRILRSKLRLSNSSLYLLVAFVVITTLWVASLASTANLAFQDSARIRSIEIGRGSLRLESFNSSAFSHHRSSGKSFDGGIFIEELWLNDIADNLTCHRFTFLRTSSVFQFEIPLSIPSLSLGFALVFSILRRSWNFRNAP